METGAATQPLTAAPRAPVAAPRAPGAPGGTGTGPLAGGGPTAALPKATQKLQAGPSAMAPRPGVAAPQSAPVKRAAASDSQQFFEEKDPEAGLVPLSVVCLIVSIVLMAAQVLSTDRMAGFTAKKGEDSTFMVPERDDPPWEKFNEEDHTYTSSFKSALPEIPQ